MPDKDNSERVAMPPSSTPKDGKWPGIDAAYEVIERRTAIRTLLMSGPRMESVEMITNHLRPLGLKGITPATVRVELAAIGAYRERDSQGMYWTIGVVGNSPLSLAPNEELHLSELQRILRQNVLEAVSLGHYVILRAAPFAGKLVGYWLNMLTWREIVSIISDDHTVQIMCIGPDQSKFVLTRLYGQQVQGKPAPKRIPDSLLIEPGMRSWEDATPYGSVPRVTRIREGEDSVESGDE